MKFDWKSYLIYKISCFDYALATNDMLIAFKDIFESVVLIVLWFLIPLWYALLYYLVL